MRRTGLKLLFIVLTVLGITAARAQTAFDDKMIARATPHFPLLNTTITDVWPDLAMRTFIPAQIEQESLWDQKAELCVPRPSCARERGVGFGQFTITPRFNIFEEVKAKHPALKGWRWEDRFDAGRQFIAITVMDRNLYRQCIPLMSNEYGGLACTASSYNGGFGGFQADRRLCGNTVGCNPRQWTGHIEKTSLKAKAAMAGYGKSFFEINREYVSNVLIKRSPKYTPFMER